MELPNANEKRNSIVISEDYYNKIVNKIIRNKSGQVTMMASNFSCSRAECKLAIERLETKGYTVTWRNNSYGVPYLEITY